LVALHNIHFWGFVLLLLRELSAESLHEAARNRIHWAEKPFDIRRKPQSDSCFAFQTRLSK
jgi:hypothetical protein